MKSLYKQSVFRDNPLHIGMKLDPRHLAQLSVIHEAGSFELAAKRLGLTQPALSRNMRKLEERLGTPIFTRNGRRSIPNGIGRRLAQNGIAIRDAQETASVVAAQISKGAMGELRLGAPPVLAGKFLTPALAEFMNKNPNCSVELRSGLLYELKSMLGRGQIDLVIGPRSIADPNEGLEFEFIMQDCLGILARQNHPIISLSNLTATELESQAWLMPSRGSQMRQQAELALLAAGVSSINVRCETDNIRSALELVEESDLITPMPRKSIAPYLENRLAFIDFNHPQFLRPVGAIRRRNTSINRIEEVFLEGLKLAFG
jgi:DNA-binding transcriptional LysR family regulator